jgi:hypothetical protein
MNNKPLILVAAVIALLIAVAVVVVVLDKQGGAEPLPVDRFIESSANFTGNRYQVTGRVESQLASREGVGRLIVLSVPGNGAERKLPVLIPHDVGINVEAGVQYQFQVWIRQTKGMVITEVQSVRKL